jgi:2-C-methyl-D-erythritol 4-phosphate cytidylyltransferase/2-C-methyl-D-erythritol 2,4-cyclodiphosphate synthase
VDRVVQATLRYGAAIPVLPVSDTIKEISSSGTVLNTPDRGKLSAAQTPQGARTDWLMEALEGSRSGSMTDEAAALEAAGRTVHIVDGEQENLKITTQEDLAILRRRLGEDDGMRIGSGYDVHRFGGERPLVLAGVRFPGETGLLGHSDADVVLHAVMDALLGAAGLGDIGQQFPPTDPAYKDADSRLLTRTVVERISGAGFKVANVDITLLAERPRIGPRLEEMKTALAALLELESSCIGLKATTLEGMGALGRAEGIACQAVALLARSDLP